MIPQIMWLVEDRCAVAFLNDQTCMEDNKMGKNILDILI